MHKTLQRFEVKDAVKGEVSAVFSTYNVIDKDGDVTLPGAIKDGTEVVISAYGHKSWEGLLPVGKGVIRATDTEAILEGQFFLSTTAGRETFEVVKELGKKQEWSYSLQNVTAEQGELEGQPVRFIKSVGTIKEVSPVLVGAGVNTRTLATKGDGSRESAGGAIPVATTEGVDALRARHAWYGGDDPESKSSYAFEHHTADGSMDLRSCLVGIAHLNGAKGGPTIPEQDRQAVYDHLAAHLEENEHNTPDLSKGSGISFAAQLGVALVDLDAALDRAGEVVALRAAKGKRLSDESTLLVEWIRDALRKAQDVLDTPQESLEREFARFIRTSQEANPS